MAEMEMNAMHARDPFIDQLRRELELFLSNSEEDGTPSAVADSTESQSTETSIYISAGSGERNPSSDFTTPDPNPYISPYDARCTTSTINQSQTPPGHSVSEFTFPVPSSHSTLTTDLHIQPFNFSAPSTSTPFTTPSNHYILPLPLSYPSPIASASNTDTSPYNYASPYNPPCNPCNPCPCTLPTSTSPPPPPPPRTSTPSSHPPHPPHKHPPPSQPSHP